jgi:hypothetical protein
VRLIAFVEYAAIVAGVLAVLAGRFFDLPKGFHLGVFLIGAGIALGGAEALFTRRMAFRSSEDAYEAYAGAPALILGIMALLVGAAIIGAAYLLADGTWHAMVNRLVRRPAPVLAFAGVLVIGAGILMMLNPQGRSGLAWTLLLYVPRVLLGIVVVAAGLAGIGLGAWEWLDPQAFDRFVADLPRLVERARKWLPAS